MVEVIGLYHRNIIASEDALLRIAKARYPDRWKAELLTTRKRKYIRNWAGPIRRTFWKEI